MNQSRETGQGKPSRATIDDLAFGALPRMAMLAGMELGVFTVLGEGARNGEEVAAGLGVAPRRLQPLLYSLVAAGLLTENQGRFANTPESDHYLVKGRPDFVGAVHGRYRLWWEAAFQTAASIREDRPVAEHDFSTMEPAQIRQGFLFRDPGTRVAGRDLARRFDFSRFSHLADVGGGGGSLALGAIEEYPSLRASLVDLENILATAREFLQEIGATERLEVVPADVTREVPPGRYDVAVMRSLIQVLSADQAAAAIANTGRAMEPGGLLLIHGRVVDDTRLSPPETVGFGLVFLNLYQDGAVYTEGEHREWLRAAGFTDIERHVEPDETSIFSARKE